MHACSMQNKAIQRKKSFLKNYKSERYTQLIYIICIGMTTVEFHQDLWHQKESLGYHMVFA